MPQKNYKQMAEMCQTICKAKGTEYKDWLYDQHFNYFMANAEIVSSAINKNLKGENKNG